MVKPVELQDNLSKTQLLEKVQQLHKSTPEEAQKKFAQELQKKVSEGKERVADLPKSDKIIIQHDSPDFITIPDQQGIDNPLTIGIIDGLQNIGIVRTRDRDDRFTFGGSLSSGVEHHLRRGQYIICLELIFHGKLYSKVTPLSPSVNGGEIPQLPPACGGN